MNTDVDPSRLLPNFNTTSLRDKMTLKCTQLLWRSLGNNNGMKCKLLSLRLHSEVWPLPSTYSGKTNGAVNSNKRRRSKRLQTKLRVNRDTNNIHSTGTINNVRINRKLRFLPMGTIKRVQGASQLQKKAATAGNRRNIRFSDWCRLNITFSAVIRFRHAVGE